MSAIAGIYSMQHGPLDPELGPRLMRQMMPDAGRRRSCSWAAARSGLPRSPWAS